MTRCSPLLRIHSISNYSSNPSSKSLLQHTSNALSRRIALSQSSISHRHFTTTRARQRQKLFWSGTVLDRTSRKPQQVPKDWLYSVGMVADADQGISWTDISSSPSHTLLSYKTLPYRPNQTTSQTSPVRSDQDHDGPPLKPNPEGLHKVMAIGRNSVAELGLGFSSEEATWGMTRPGFQGQEGIHSLATGLGTSWIVCNDSQVSSRLYSFGNHTSSQLGHGSSSITTSTSGDPQLQLYPIPKEVDLIDINSSSSDSASHSKTSIKILEIACGLDHTLLLVRREGSSSNEVLVCGLNTDGQLGLGETSTSTNSISTSQAIPPSSFDLSQDDDLVGISAGGDTSFAWSKNGRLFSWGNSEYGQALGNEILDQILKPREVENFHQEMGKIKDVKGGGSFVTVLDDRGQVFTCGYGAIGQGSKTLSTTSLLPLKLPLEPNETVTSIFSGLENSAASTSNGRVFVWGLDSNSGRLGLGSRNPYPSFILASRFTENDIELRIFEPVEIKLENENQKGKTEVLKVALGRDAMWILVEDGEEEVGRWDSK